MVIFVRKSLNIRFGLKAAELLRYMILVMIMTLFSFQIFAKEQRKVTLYYETASYNQKFNDHRYVDSPKESFSTPMNSSSFEFHNTGTDNHTWGIGFAGACISPETHHNYDTMERIPFTLICMPSVFAGYDFGFWSYEIGVSEYIRMQTFHSRQSYDENGKVVLSEKSDFTVNTYRSYTFINMLLRFLPEDSFHVTLHFAREKFSPIDSLYNVSFVVPFGRHSVELITSVANPVDFLVSKKRRVTSNQRVSLVYACDFDSIGIYAGAGVLAFNQHGGQSPVPMMSRFSLSFGAFAKF